MSGDYLEFLKLFHQKINQDYEKLVYNSFYENAPSNTPNYTNCMNNFNLQNKISNFEGVEANLPSFMNDREYPSNQRTMNANFMNPNFLFNNNVFNVNLPFNNFDHFYGQQNSQIFGNINILSNLLYQLQGQNTSTKSRSNSNGSIQPLNMPATNQNIIKIELPDCEFLNKKRENDDVTEKKQAIKNNKFVYVLSKVNSRRRDKICDERKLISNHKSKNLLPPDRTGKRGSKFRGVSRNGNQWQVLIMVKKRKRYVGSYSNEIEAARNYDKVAIQHHGNKAKTNYFYTDQEIANIRQEPLLLHVDEE